MDSSTYSILFCFLVFFVVVLIVGKNISNSVKNIIRAEILRCGGEVIEISSDYFWGSHGQYSYTVVFRDQFGQKHQTTCITYAYGKIRYWSKTPAEIMANAQLANAPTVFNDAGNERTEPTTKSSKEQIIDDLHAENLRLREELGRLRNNE